MEKEEIKPEDILELILDKIECKWHTIEEVEGKVQIMLGYFKAKKFDKLQNEFGF